MTELNRKAINQFFKGLGIIIKYDQYNGELILTKDGMSLILYGQLTNSKKSVSGAHLKAELEVTK